jgi:hypothetical protein
LQARAAFEEALARARARGDSASFEPLLESLRGAKEALEAAERVAAEARERSAALRARLDEIGRARAALGPIERDPEAAIRAVLSGALATHDAVPVIQPDFELEERIVALEAALVHGRAAVEAIRAAMTRADARPAGGSRTREDARRTGAAIEIDFSAPIDPDAARRLARAGRIRAEARVTAHEAARLRERLREEATLGPAPAEGAGAPEPAAAAAVTTFPARPMRGAWRTFVSDLLPALAVVGIAGAVVLLALDPLARRRSATRHGVRM